jgi:transcriptional regulator with XRE-family HTH domain
VPAAGRRDDERPREGFARNLRAARAEAGLSQERLSALAKLHRTEISLLERGERDPKLSTIMRLADALGVQAATLVARDDRDLRRSARVEAGDA